MTLSHPCPQTLESDTEVHSPPDTQVTDLRSRDALREAITQVSTHGWDSAIGRTLLDALTGTCQRLAIRMEASAHLVHDHSHSDDLLSHAWELINSNPDAVVTADNPWAYLTTCLRRTLTNTLVADALLVSPIAVRNGTAARVGLRPPVRAGDQWTEMEPRIGYSAPAGRTDRHWDVGLQRLHEHLVRLGAPAATTSIAIDRVNEIVSEVRRGRRESAVAADSELAGLGLTAAQGRALLALLIGARHDQGRSSLWLHLRDNASTATGSPTRTDRRVRTYLRPSMRRTRAQP